MMPQGPVPGSKPSPCSVEETAARAADKAHVLFMLDDWFSKCASAGVITIAISIGEFITLGDTVRTTTVRLPQNKNIPISAYFAAALEKFKAEDPYVDAPADMKAASETPETPETPLPEIQNSSLTITVAGRAKLPLPMCKQCKVQPVNHHGGEFCGPQCAQIWYKIAMFPNK